MTLLQTLATNGQYFEVLGFTILMYIASVVITKLSGSDPKAMMEMQAKVQQLQQQTMLALQTDPERARQLQQEMLDITQQTLKKTCIPSLIRMVLFFVFFGILNAIYQGVQFFSVNILIFGNGAVALYFLYSLGLSFSVSLVKYMIKKAKGEVKPKNPVFQDIAGAMTPHMRSDILTSKLSPELLKLREDLQQKQADGTLPQDIDIDAEIKKMQDSMENENKTSNQEASNENNTDGIGVTNSAIEESLDERSGNKSWKNKIKDNK